jgi:hypothetical protein
VTHLVAEQLGWQPFRRQVNQWRRQTLGRAPVGLLGVPAPEQGPTCAAEGQ